jgi:hypothetical protein
VCPKQCEILGFVDVVPGSERGDSMGCVGVCRVAKRVSRRPTNAFEARSNAVGRTHRIVASVIRWTENERSVFESAECRGNEVDRKRGQIASDDDHAFVPFETILERGAEPLTEISLWLYPRAGA